MPCNLKNVISSGTHCKENPAGLSNHVFVVPLSKTSNLDRIGIDDSKNAYKIELVNGATALKGFRIDFKSQTGQVTSEANPMGAGWSHTGTGRVELNEDDMALVSRTLHNTDKNLYFFPTGKVVNGLIEYKVVGNPFGETEWSVAADSGANRSDDHGQTFTVTCAYQVYPVMKWWGIIEEANDDSFSDDSDDMVDVDSDDY